MSKAKYSTEPLGHFGLAFPFYSHFTSPIRRYPDMMAHRMLQHYLDKGDVLERAAWEMKAKHSSEMEKLASEAERASIKYKQVEYMSLMDPAKEWEGIISGVTEFGIFVEITETASEGLIRMVDLNDDYYDFDRDNFRIVGQRKGRVFTFGDKLTVRVKETNLSRRSMDLELVGMAGNRGRKSVDMRASRQKMKEKRGGATTKERKEPKFKGNRRK
jgi:ribonuclease R